MKHDNPINVLNTLIEVIDPITAAYLVRPIIGSINASSVGYAQAVIRRAERDARGAESGVDGFNETLNAQAERAVEAQAMEDMGLENRADPSEILEGLAAIKAGLSEHFPPNQWRYMDDPASTVEFMASRKPNNQAAEALVKALAAAGVEVDLETAKRAVENTFARDSQWLREHAGEIVELIAGTSGHREFDDLPGRVQAKIARAILRGIERQIEQATTQVVRGNLDAAGNITFLSEAKKQITAWMDEAATTNPEFGEAVAFAA